jgi:hypothetical protein
MKPTHHHSCVADETADQSASTVDVAASITSHAAAAATAKKRERLGMPGITD